MNIIFSLLIIIFILLLFIILYMWNKEVERQKRKKEILKWLQIDLDRISKKIKNVPYPISKEHAEIIIKDIEDDMKSYDEQLKIYDRFI